MRIAAVVLLFAVAGLAGCLDGGEDEPQEERVILGPEADKDPFNDWMIQPEEQPAPNTPPTAAVVPDVVNGTAPLNVTFTLEGEDPDGDNLTWALDVNGDGTSDATGEELPASYTTNYTENGTFNVTFAVFDGEATTVANTTIVVLNGTAEVVVPAGPKFEYTDTATLALFAVTGGTDWAYQCPGFILHSSGDGCVIFDFEADHTGAPYVITPDEGFNLRFAFWNDCSLPPLPGDGIEFGDSDDVAQGVVPAGATCIVMWSSGALNAGSDVSYTMVVG